MTRAVVHFMLRFLIVHTVVYFLIHGISYEWYLSIWYSNPDSNVSSFMRNPDDSRVWAHVWRWILPAQILRGVFLSLAFTPFYIYLMQMTRSKRFLVIAFILFFIGGLGTYIPGPGSVEGLLHMHPDLGLGFHLAFQPIVLIESFLTAGFIALWMGPKRISQDLIKHT
jgi:hypothetical protein